MDILSKNPANVKWSDKKIRSIKVAERMFLAGFEERSKAIRFCGSILIMKKCEVCGSAEVKSANLCRDRMCPTCQWRLALKRFAQMCNVFDFLYEKEEFCAGFLTLTVKNCIPEKLEATLSEMSKDWNRLLAHKDVKRLVLGWARSVEITYNKRNRTFHPHYHVILLLKRQENPDYLRELFKAKWQRVAKLEYMPIVDFRYIKNVRENAENMQDNAENSIKNAILETYKYIVKEADEEAMPLGIFREMVRAITGKRLVAFGGNIKEARKMLRLSDEITDEDAGNPGNICSSCGAETKDAIYKWSFGEKRYVEYN